MICPRCSKPLKPANHLSQRVWICLSCHHHEGEITQKEAESLIITAQTKVFKKNKGKIETIHHTQNWSYSQPITRTRKEQVNWARKFMPKG